MTTPRKLEKSKQRHGDHEVQGATETRKGAEMGEGTQGP